MVCSGEGTSAESTPPSDPPRRPRMKWTRWTVLRFVATQRTTPSCEACEVNMRTPPVRIGAVRGGRGGEEEREGVKETDGVGQGEVSVMKVVLERAAGEDGW